MSEQEGFLGTEMTHHTQLHCVDSEDDADLWVASSRAEEIDEVECEVRKNRRELLEDLWQDVQDKYWFMQPEYRNYQPHEQWDITIGNDTIPVYNYAENVHLDKDQVQTIGVYIRFVSTKFPTYYTPLSAITITDRLPEHVFEGDEEFPYHGEAQPMANMFALTPYSLEPGDYRPDLKVPRLPAATLHEEGHIAGLDIMLEPQWPEGGTTNYGLVGGPQEDIPESLVAFAFQAPLDAEKRDILAELASWLPLPEISVVKCEQIVLPELPEELSYYLDDKTVDELEDQ